MTKQISPFEQNVKAIRRHMEQSELNLIVGGLVEFILVLTTQLLKVTPIVTIPISFLAYRFALGGEGIEHVVIGLVLAEVFGVIALHGFADKALTYIGKIARYVTSSCGAINTIIGVGLVISKQANILVPIGFLYILAKPYQKF